MEHFITQESRAFLGRWEPESDTIKSAELFTHIVAYLYLQCYDDFEDSLREFGLRDYPRQQPSRQF